MGLPTVDTPIYWLALTLASADSFDPLSSLHDASARMAKSGKRKWLNLFIGVWWNEKSATDRICNYARTHFLVVKKSFVSYF